MEIRRTKKFARAKFGSRVVEGVLTPKLACDGELQEPEMADVPDDAYRQFAEIADETGVVKFANRYGVLGMTGAATWRGTSKSARIHDEHVSNWLREAKALRTALERYREAIESQDVLALMDVVEIANGYLHKFPPLALAAEGGRVVWRVEAPSLLAELWRQFADSLVRVGATVATPPRQGHGTSRATATACYYATGATAGRTVTGVT
jgi:hypothetical protein